MNRSFPIVALLSALLLTPSGADGQEPPTFGEALTIFGHMQRLRSNDDSVRIQAAKALKTIGPKATSARALLTRMAESDPDDDVRRVAKEALAAIGSPETPSSEPKALLDKLHSPDASVRLGVLKSLKAAGPAMKAPLPELAKLAASDPDDDVRQMAKEALKAAVPATLAEELARTNSRISSVEAQVAALRIELVVLNHIKADTQQKVDTALSSPSPDNAVVTINQNAVLVNSAKIAFAQQEIVRLQEEAPGLERNRAQLEEAIKQSGKK